MENKIRIFALDGDTVTVSRKWDEEIGQYISDYPDFKENPRITSSGRQWVNVMNDDCPYADKEYGDCGSCKYFRCERPGDMIGICDNQNLILESERKEA